jgi:NAD(P)-dependent dehydrogenase (short-subunit alcohol dehydrogenase family)
LSASRHDGATRELPLAGRVAVVSGGGRGLGRAFCLALARQGARVVVNNRNRLVDGDGLGPADHVTAEITATGGEAVADCSDAAAVDSGLSAYAASKGGLLAFGGHWPPRALRAAS